MLVYVAQRHLACYEPWNGNKKGRQEEKRLMSDNQEVNECTFKTHSSNEGNIISLMLSNNTLHLMQKSARIILRETGCFSSMAILGKGYL